MVIKKWGLLIASVLLCISLISCETSSDQSTDIGEIISGSTDKEADSSISNEETSSEDEKEVIGEFITETGADMKTYTNYLMDEYTENAWERYGFGDPFVMRYNGKYYLYSSTKDWHAGIKVWVSDDLINWEYGGYCAVDKVTTGSYAPEVTYYNGYFYMYTSPAGKGHYVLRSKSPLGQFKVISQNLGNSIDGHVFIDDDGKWYFYHAAEGDIAVKEMRSPTDLSAEDGSANVDVAGGWTEGPMVIKYNDAYYMTYCGNHVWSKGYRIEGAVGSSPLQFNDVEKNILLLNTDSLIHGIGHSSTVVGPNMDTYYIVYHSFNRVGRRRMHIDALNFNGKDFSVLGPTMTPQQVPDMPEIYTDSTEFSDKFTYEGATLTGKATKLSAGGKILTAEDVDSEKYTAEINFLSMNKTGIFFSYVDELNYGFAYIDTSAQTLTVTVTENGEKVFEETVYLPKSFGQKYNFETLQALSIKADGNKHSFRLNGLTLATYKLNVKKGKIGVTTSDYATLGYMAVSFDANGSSLKTQYKPIESTFYATTSVEDGATVKRYGIPYVVMKEGYIRNYYVNVSKTALYDAEIMYYASEDTELELYKGGKLLGKAFLPKGNGSVTSVALRSIELEQGFGIISFKVTKGKANVLSYAFTQTATPKESEISLDSYYHFDGEWVLHSDSLTLTKPQHVDVSCGKVLYGDERWSDYTAQADFTFEGHNKSAGLIIRGKKPSLGGAGDDASAGKFFFQGYHVSFDTTKGIVIYKVNYERTEAIAFPTEIESGVTYNLKVEATNNVLKVYLDGKLLGTLEDTYLPFLNGAVGVTGINTQVTVENLKISPVK